MPEPDLVAAIDAGTTGTRCVLVGTDGNVVASAYAEHGQIAPQPGWVEHDPLELAARALEVMDAVLAQVEPARVAAVGIANQRETTVLWEAASGRPVANAIVWQDTRTAARCAELAGEAGWIRDRTGLEVSPYFSATKLGWLLDHVPEARARAERGELRFGTVDSWLAQRLAGVHVTDATNASRTLLARLGGGWDDDLLAAFGIPPAVLPAIVPSWQPGGYGTTAAGLPLAAAIGDQQAALFGQACFAAGRSKNTYGTGSFLLVNTGDAAVRSPGLLTSPAYLPPDGAPAYCLEGAVATTGRAVQWLRDELGVIGSAAETAALAASVPDAGGVRVVPAFQGLYAPWWDASARGAILGLSLHSTRAHVVRAMLDAIAFLTRAVVEAVEAATGAPVTTLRVDGGAAANDFLMQLQADVLGLPVERPALLETTALGAAYAAGLAAGVWRSLDDIGAHHRIERQFEPVWSASQRDAEYADWLRAVERARHWA
jgi:glycerol kinase